MVIDACSIPKHLNTNYETNVLIMKQFNQNWNNIANLLYEYPGKEWKVRELSAKANMPLTTVHRTLQSMRKTGFINERNALIVNQYTKFLKTFHMIDKLFSSGLLEFLQQELVPSCIIIFGGVRKGEYDADSDIDLFVETTKEKKVDLSVFEKKLNHPIH